MCDCERRSGAVLAQGAYLLNDAEMLTKIRSAKGRLTARLASSVTDAELIDEFIHVGPGPGADPARKRG